MKSVMQNYWEKLKGQIFLIFVIFHVRKVPCLLKPLLWTSASPYFDFVCFRQCRRHWDTLSLLILVIMFNESCFFGDLSQAFLNRILAPGAFQKILWKQVVTCSAHSKKHFKTNLAEYWGEGVHGRSSYFPDYWHCGNGQSIALSERVFWRQNSSATHATPSALRQR